ncbi:proton-translocating transhydrogenase family protein [Parvularcula sp. IMCC14364]|uniref:proton-translocating transhydrogenase family protein n=1 Tax=Parvularcula sp. IMCC14364 TaxID=3067902 RepID=UPI0027411F24|nr:proton-translocating transhydrogenase family protein [Parvularcula sp. IMCC14364]
MFLLQKSDPEKSAEEAKKTAEELQQTVEQLKETTDTLEASSQQLNSQMSAFEAMLDTGHINEYVFLGTIFILAIFVGYYVVWSVTPALHTPLMSVTNAVSSVVIVGALIAVGADISQSPAGGWSRALGVIGVALASVNIFGGFLVTQRMLAMYKKKERPAAGSSN